MPKPSDTTAAIALQWLYPAIATVLVSVISVSAAQSRGTAPADPSQLCLTAAHHAARQHNVPFDVMHKVSLVETGRQSAAGVTPWPWAVHATAQGHWPATREGALAIIRSALNAGHSNIDIGCFQINYHWHSENFASLDAMLDPAQNADYAAHLLHGHYQRLGRGQRRSARIIPQHPNWRSAISRASMPLRRIRAARPARHHPRKAHKQPMHCCNPARAGRWGHLCRSR